MRLTELDPNWWTIAEGRTGMGITFLCPHCRALNSESTQYLGIWFANPVDGGPPAPIDLVPNPRWKRTDDTFETITIEPSINASDHWHGFIINGEVTNA